jgi:hypothetical protein
MALGIFLENNSDKKQGNLNDRSVQVSSRMRTDFFKEEHTK